MMFSEALKSIKNTKVFTSLIILQFTISFIVVNTVFYNIESMQNSKQKYDGKLTEKTRYQISDNLEGSQLNQFFKSDYGLSHLKGFYSELNQGEGYTFLETIIQPIYVANYTGADMFREGYENGDDLDSYNYENEGITYAFIKAVMLNENAWDEFKLRVGQGKTFSSDEYILPPHDFSLPVILGYEYASDYKLGERLSIIHYTKKLTMEVVGFLEQDSVMRRRDGSLMYLDRYVLLPAVIDPNEPVSEEDRSFQMINYLSKVNGTIQMAEGYSLGSFIAAFEQLRQKYDMFDFSVWDVSNWEVKLLKLTAGKSIHLMMLIGWIMIGFATISLSVIMTTKLQRNKLNYGIHLMCGGTIRNMMSYVFTECFLIFIVSHILAYSITAMLFSKAVGYSLYWILFSSIIVIGSCVQPLVYLSKLNIDTMLRRKD
ncbi:hypothetical protein [Paenibacillus apiarius]|uniref:hypothetical protein n=1 Tax=Paenibacillus apiarius TaxID=46240 RepID=UPI00197FB11D|nr:hypothetical protein [Paenibacillus apiarius]MBN3525197.1 hypothetical protein [Paenibacillus apiarius]